MSPLGLKGKPSLATVFLVVIMVAIILLTSVVVYNTFAPRTSRVYTTTQWSTVTTTETIGSYTETVVSTETVTRTTTVTTTTTITEIVSGTYTTTHTPTSTQTITTTTPGGEYQYVYINGTVYGVPEYDTSGNNLRIKFTVLNQSKEIDVYAYGEIARYLVDNNLIPFHGDYFQGIVQYRVRETYEYGVIDDTSKISIEKLVGEPEIVYSLDTSMEYRLVVTKGVLEDVQTISNGYLLYIDTGVDIVKSVLPNILKLVDEDRFNSILENLTTGSNITVSGVVYVYKGYSPEILVRSLDDIVVEKPETYPVVKIASLGEHVGETVELENTILGEISYSSGEYLVKIYDDTGSAILSIDRDVFTTQFNPYTEGVGSKATLIVYVESSTTVTLVDYQITQPYPSPLLDTSMVNESIIGYTVALKGTITDLYIRDTYVKFFLEDDKGSIEIFIPGSVYDSLENKDLVEEGSMVTIAGYVSTYRDELEVVLYSPVSVQDYSYQVPGEGYGIPQLPEHGEQPPGGGGVKLSELPDYLGETVWVIVSFDSIDYDSDLHMYVLGISDDTGSAYAIVDTSLTREAIDPWSTGCGSTLNITGTVEYSSYYGYYVEALEISVVEAVAPPVVTVEQALEEPLGEIVVIQQVTVLNYTEVGSGSWVLYVTDGTATIKVFIPRSVVNQLPDDVVQAIQNGGAINLAGYTDIYKGEREIVVYTPSGVTT